MCGFRLQIGRHAQRGLQHHLQKFGRHLRGSGHWRRSLSRIDLARPYPALRTEPCHQDDRLSWRTGRRRRVQDHSSPERGKDQKAAGSMGDRDLLAGPPASVQFGHAGAKADSHKETAQAKNDAFRDVGLMCRHHSMTMARHARVYEMLLAKGSVLPFEEPEVPKIPSDYSKALASGDIRKPTTFICTVSDDSGEEVLYAGKKLSDVLGQKMGIGGVVGLLWFKKELPDYASNFIELVLQIVANHGPAVSGAHNAIVASCAGKDLISSLCSGLLTIGPRFGGAIDDAAREFKHARETDLAPEQFVNEMKKKGINIPGIGHKIKSVKNPDKRVQLLISYARANFPSTELLNYALQVEELTTAKKGNLILNVDGCIGILFIDLMSSCGSFTKEEIDEVVRLGYLNGLFALGRSIGLIGHILDQKGLAPGCTGTPQTTSLI